MIDDLLALDDATLRATLHAMKTIPSARERWRERQAMEKEREAEDLKEVMGVTQPDPLSTGRHTTQAPAAQSADDEEE